MAVGCADFTRAAKFKGNADFALRVRPDLSPLGGSPYCALGSQGLRSKEIKRGHQGRHRKPIVRRRGGRE
jgi:hypothetical protein